MKNILLVLLVILSSTVAQTTNIYTITGTCVNTKNVPITNIKVTASILENGVSKPDEWAYTDATGRFKFTYSITTDLEEEANQASLTYISYPSPNPSGGNVSFQLNTKSTEPINWIIYTITGEEVERGTISYTGKNQHLFLPFRKYSTGVYIVQFKIDDRVVSRKVNFIRGLNSQPSSYSNFSIQNNSVLKSSELILKQLTFNHYQYRAKKLPSNKLISPDIPFDVGTITIDTLGYKVSGKVFNVLKFDKPDSMYVPYVELVFTNFNEVTMPKRVVRSDITGSYSLTLPENPQTYTISAFHDVSAYGHYELKPIESFTVSSDTIKNIAVIAADSGRFSGDDVSFEKYNLGSIMNLWNILPGGVNKPWAIDPKRLQETFPKIYINSSRQEFIDEVKKRITEDHMPNFKFYDMPQGVNPDFIIGTTPPERGTSGYIIISETSSPAPISLSTTVNPTTGHIISASIAFWEWLIPNRMDIVDQDFNSCFYRAMTNLNVLSHKYIPSIINKVTNYGLSIKSGYPLFDKMNLRAIYFAPPFFDFRNDFPKY